MIIFTIINATLFLMSQLYIWGPITFRFWSWFRDKYTQFMQVALAAIITIRYMVNFGSMPDLQTLMAAIYGVGPPESVRADYRINWLSFFFYQILGWLFSLLYGS